MLEVLRHNVTDERCEVARAVSFVEQALKILPFSLVDQLQVVVLLIDELSLEFVHAFLLSKYVCQDDGVLPTTGLRSLIEGKP